MKHFKLDPARKYKDLTLEEKRYYYRERYKWQTHGEKAYRFYCEAKKDGCAKCGTKEGFLDLHHIDEDPRNDDLSNLIILCRGCHNAVRGYFNPEDRQIKVEWFWEWLSQ